MSDDKRKMMRQRIVDAATTALAEARAGKGDTFPIRYAVLSSNCRVTLEELGTSIEEMVRLERALDVETATRSLTESRVDPTSHATRALMRALKRSAVPAAEIGSTDEEVVGLLRAYIIAGARHELLRFLSYQVSMSGTLEDAMDVKEFGVRITFEDLGTTEAAVQAVNRGRAIGDAQRALTQLRSGTKHCMLPMMLKDAMHGRGIELTFEEVGTTPEEVAGFWKRLVLVPKATKELNRLRSGNGSPDAVRAALTEDEHSIVLSDIGCDDEQFARLERKYNAKMAR